MGFNPLTALVVGGGAAFAGKKAKSKPKAPEVPAEQLALEQQQRVDRAKLDKEENEKRKRLLAATQGLRFFRGSPLARSAPGNTAGAGAVAQAPDYGSMFRGEGLFR